MAVLSRPSLRSSARKDHVPELPATDVPPRSRPTRRPSKRTRDCSLDNESNASSKRFKTSPQQALRGKDKLSKKEPITIPIRDKKPLRPASKKSPVTRGSPSRKLPAASKHTVPNASIDHTHNPPPKTVQHGLIPVLMQPRSEIAEKNDKRSLRSHDGGSRSKSELAMYIPNYEDLISIEPKTADTITSDTILYVVDDPTSSTSVSSPTSSLPQPPTSKGKKSLPNGIVQVIEWPEETFTVLTDATRLNLSALKTAGRHPKKDPLNDDIYLKIHRKLERQEKQLRNIEKERAMHEKSQLERLSEGLKGHDWLRVMGISGITDGEKKAYEPKRDHLIGEVRILLNKFRIWKEEEKRRKVEREAEAEAEDDEEEDDNADELSGEEEDDEAEEEQDEEDEEDVEDEVEDSEEEGIREEDDEDDGEKGGGRSDEEDEEPTESEGVISDGDPPDYSDIDASALQLRLEAARANQPFAKFSTTVKRQKPQPQIQPPTYTQQSITSFFSKPYQRQAAVGNHRRGRSKYAFGQPLPEPEEQLFELPGDVLTEEVLAASERKRRAAKRRRESDED